MVRMKEIRAPASYRVEKQCQLFPLGCLRWFFLVVREVVLGWLLLIPFGGVWVAPGQKRLTTIIALASHVWLEVPSLDLVAVCPRRFGARIAFNCA